MFIENLKLNKKSDILLLDEIGERIKLHLMFDPTIRKLKLSHYEINQIQQDNKFFFKYTFFYDNVTKEFLIDDYHIAELVDNKLKYNDVLTSDYNVLMCRKMFKQLDNNSYYENLLSNLNDKEIQSFEKSLQMHADLIDLYEYYDKKNMER
ncbi:MAG: hypothetical protein IKA36_05500 [Clostridia bacterium]|nr:hypothetical protein [Clostridia bacterium]